MRTMIGPDDKALELILQYKMNEIEAKSFKIACIYLEKCRKLLPNYNHIRFPKGDPRKSELFRYCYKLFKETQHKIKEEEYVFYVHAQLDIMKNIKKNDIYPLVTPSCLVGDKAWKRWLLWKGKYDKMVEKKTSTSDAPANSVQKIKKDLWKTKQFFNAWFDRLDREDIVNSFKDNNIFLWYQTGNVCGYYFNLSEIAKKWIENNKSDLTKFNLDLSRYNVSDKEILEYFESEFNHEFNK